MVFGCSFTQTGGIKVIVDKVTLADSINSKQLQKGQKCTEYLGIVSAVLLQFMFVPRCSNSINSLLHWVYVSLHAKGKQLAF